MDTAAHPDVFISYAREDRESASRFAQWCTASGWTVWWDEAIAPGRKWDQAIERALADARCVLVLWSAHSVASDWVKTEAAEAARRGVLVPVLIERVAPPLEFRRLQTLDLADGWARSGAAALERLRSALAEHIGRPPEPTATPSAPRTGRWRAAAVAALMVALAGTALWRAFPTATPVTAPTAATPTVEPLPRHSGEEVATPQTSVPGIGTPGPRAPTPRPAPGLTGVDVAQLADLQRQAVIDKADKSSLFWTAMLEQEGGAALLEQAVLLAVEAVRRKGGVAADSALRRALVLMPRPLRSLAHDDAVLMLAFSPDGRMMATTSRDWTAVLWDTASGRKSITLKHRDTVSDIAFSPDGRLVATASSDKTARLWQVSDGKELALLQQAGPVQSVLFGGDGRLLATISRRDTDVDVRLWSVPEGRETRRIVPPKQMHEFVFSDDGRYLFGKMPDGHVEPVLVWDVASGERVAALSAGARGIGSMATHGDVLALGESGASGPMVSLWRLRSWAPLGQVHGMRTQSVVALSADAARLVVGESAARHAQIMLAPVAEGQTRATALSARKNGGICCLTTSADGTRAVASSVDDIATVIDLRSGEELLRARLPTTGSLRAALSPDGRLLLTAGGAGANLWEVTPADPARTACERVKRSFTPEEWRRWFGDEPWRKTCA